MIDFLTLDLILRVDLVDVAVVVTVGVVDVVDVVVVVTVGVTVVVIFADNGGCKCPFSL